MPHKNGHHKQKVPIYDTEIDFLHRVEEIESKHSLSHDQLWHEYSKLKKEFSGLLMQSRKIIRTGDSMQKKLMTLSKKLEHQNKLIKEQNVELKKLNATKDKFFTIVSHDLKNPLGAFLNFSELLILDYKNITDDDKYDHLKLMYKTAKNMNGLLENLLNWSKSQSRQMSFSPRKKDMNDIISRSIGLLLSHSKSKNITIDNMVQEGSMVVCDENMISSVVRNLLHNAIKFTKKGGLISINSEISDYSIKFSIKDSGIGIPNKDIEKIFKIDEQYTQKGTTKESGTGLGLILCKDFLEKHESELIISTKVKVGTTMSFHLKKSTHLRG